METLYRKVAVSERLPKDSGYYFAIDSLGHREYPYFDNDENKWESIWETVYWLEPIPDPTDKLKADKEELLGVLENLTEYGSTGEDAVEMKREIESLIQKMKQ